MWWGEGLNKEVGPVKRPGTQGEAQTPSGGPEGDKTDPSGGKRVTKRGKEGAGNRRSPSPLVKIRGRIKTRITGERGPSSCTGGRAR